MSAQRTTSIGDNAAGISESNTLASGSSSSINDDGHPITSLPAFEPEDSYTRFVPAPNLGNHDHDASATILAWGCPLCTLPEIDGVLQNVPEPESEESGAQLSRGIRQTVTDFRRQNARLESEVKDLKTSMEELQSELKPECPIPHLMPGPVRAPCGHRFCAECITTWLREQGTCPICRKAVRSEDLQRQKAQRYGRET